MALPNPTMSFSPFAILTAEEMNDLVENIESLSEGTGFEAGAIGTDTLADSAVTAAKTSFGGSYSTSEVNTGFTWVDGKTIYKKTISFGTIPSATTKTVNHSITNLGLIIAHESLMTDSGGNRFPLPFVRNNSGTDNVELRFNSTQVAILTASANFVSYSAYMTILYTKTS